MRRLLCRTNTEKTAAVLQRAGIEVGEKNLQPAGQRTLETAAPGHGRLRLPPIVGPARSRSHMGRYTREIGVPECLRGKVYPLRDPGLRPRVKAGG